MKIKVFGPGCSNCKKLLTATKAAVANKGVDAEVEYVTDIKKIAASGIMRTPALMIDDKIVSSGRVLTTDQIEKML